MKLLKRTQRPGFNSANCSCTLKAIDPSCQVHGGNTDMNKLSRLDKLAILIIGSSGTKRDRD